MIKQILTILLPLLAPTIAYLIWGWFMRKRKHDLDDGKKLEAWQTWPWRYLVGAGAILSMISLLLLGLTTNNNLTGKYIPPTVIDGELVPGHFIPDEN